MGGRRRAFEAHGLLASFAPTVAWLAFRWDSAGGRPPRCPKPPAVFLSGHTCCFDPIRPPVAGAKNSRNPSVGATPLAVPAKKIVAWRGRQRFGFFHCVSNWPADLPRP